MCLHTLQLMKMSFSCRCLGQNTCARYNLCGDLGVVVRTNSMFLSSQLSLDLDGLLLRSGWGCSNMFLCVCLCGFELTAHWLSSWDSGHSTGLPWRLWKLYQGVQPLGQWLEALLTLEKSLTAWLWASSAVLGAPASQVASHLESHIVSPEECPRHPELSPMALDTSFWNLSSTKSKNIQLWLAVGDRTSVSLYWAFYWFFTNQDPQDGLRKEWAKTGKSHTGFY